MRSTRLLGVMLASMAAAVGYSAQPAGGMGAAARALKPPKTLEPSRTVGSSRNGGLRSGNRANQRAAQKKRNQLRHRLACRG